MHINIDQFEFDTYAPTDVNAIVVNTITPGDNDFRSYVVYPSNAIMLNAGETWDAFE